MSFLGSISKKWKKVKHKVDSVASPSHIAMNAIWGKKKGQAIGDQVDIAVGSAYTFGLGKLAANAGQAAEAKDKLKKQNKAAKKAAKLAIKKGLVDPEVQYQAGYVPAVTGYATRPGGSTPMSQRASASGYGFGPKSSRNLTLAGAGIELAGQFVDDGSSFQRLLDSGQGILSGISGDDGGDDFGPLPDVSPAEPRGGSNIPTWAIAAGAGLALLLLVRK